MQTPNISLYDCGRPVKTLPDIVLDKLSALTEGKSIKIKNKYLRGKNDFFEVLKFPFVALTRPLQQLQPILSVRAFSLYKQVLSAHKHHPTVSSTPDIWILLKSTGAYFFYHNFKLEDLFRNVFMSIERVHPDLRFDIKIVQRNIFLNAL